MYSNNKLNFQESTTILNACTKKSGNLLKAPRIWEDIIWRNKIDRVDSSIFRGRLIIIVELSIEGFDMMTASISALLNSSDDIDRSTLCVTERMDIHVTFRHL